MKAVLWMPRCKAKLGFSTKASCSMFCRLRCRTLCKEKNKTPIKLEECIDIGKK